MLKKIGPFILAAFLLVLLIVGYSGRNNMNRFISEKMKEQATAETKLSANELIQKNYNYAENTLDYDFTLLEFGSTGCAVCKRMEPVLEEIRNTQQTKVNVVFLHIMKSENQSLMKYYGISAVPMQILLDKQGREFFRHYGFISAAELMKKLNN
jgi:thioredoxin 1